MTVMVIDVSLSGTLEVLLLLLQYEFASKGKWMNE
jgi:hypothetical protein